MGLLDDAIREHLDLKRRHGADPTEIDRAEQEALGPVRRGSGELAEAALEDQPDAEQDLAYEDEEESYWVEDFDSEEEPLPEELGADDMTRGEVEPGGAGAPRDDEPRAPDDATQRWAPYDHEEDVRDPGPTGEAPDPHRGHSSGEGEGAETVEYEVDEQSLKEGDEMLEETPEFLRDTPDHDRLWFEQRPPRDSDFDN